jgi:hypothetical protein
MWNVETSTPRWLHVVGIVVSATLFATSLYFSKNIVAGVMLIVFLANAVALVSPRRGLR